MQGFYRNHMEEVIKFFETHHKVTVLVFSYRNFVMLGNLGESAHDADNYLLPSVQFLLLLLLLLVHFGIIWHWK